MRQLTISAVALSLLVIGQGSAGALQPQHRARPRPDLQAQFRPYPGAEHGHRRDRDDFEDDLDDCLREDDRDDRRDCLEDLRRDQARDRDRDDFEDDLDDCRDEDDRDDRRDCFEDLWDDYDRDGRRRPRRRGGPPYLNRDR